MLIYLCFIYFNGYSKIKICIKKTNLLGLFSLYLLFFQFYNKISNWFPVVLNEGKICRIVTYDHLRGAGTGAKRSPMTIENASMGTAVIHDAEGHDEERLQVRNKKKKTKHQDELKTITSGV